MQNRAAFNSIAAQQQAALNNQFARGLGGLGQAPFHRQILSLSQEMQNDLDAYLKDWKGE